MHTVSKTSISVLKLQQLRFQSASEVKSFLSIQTMKHRSKLPIKVVGTSISEDFKDLLDLLGKKSTSALPISFSSVILSNPIFYDQVCPLSWVQSPLYFRKHLNMPMTSDVLPTVTFSGNIKMFQVKIHCLMFKSQIFLWLHNTIAASPIYSIFLLFRLLH